MVMMVGRIPLQRMLVEHEQWCCGLGMGMVMVDDVMMNGMERCDDDGMLA